MCQENNKLFENVHDKWMEIIKVNNGINIWSVDGVVRGWGNEGTKGRGLGWMGKTKLNYQIITIQWMRNEPQDIDSTEIPPHSSKTRDGRIIA